MTLMSLADCCRRLSVDPKTFRRWLKQAQLELSPHPTDGRSKGLGPEQLEQVATAHRRTLVPDQTQPPAEPATSRPVSARASAAELALPSSDLLSVLVVQLLRMQEQLEQLSHQLEQLLPEVAGPVHPAALEEAAAVASPPAVLPAASNQQQTVQETPPRPPARVLPLVEYGRDGPYVVICPTEGRLSFEPDSPQWFAWLESRSSFRFVGKAARFTAHRESDRLPNAVWRAHRKVRNHTYNQRLAHPPELTISVLEQAAATLQAHLLLQGPQRMYIDRGTDTRAVQVRLRTLIHIGARDELRRQDLKIEFASRAVRCQDAAIQGDGVELRPDATNGHPVTHPSRAVDRNAGQPLQ